MKHLTIHCLEIYLFPRVTCTIPRHGHIIINVRVLLLACTYSSYFHVLTITNDYKMCILVYISEYFRSFYGTQYLELGLMESCSLEGLGEF